MTDLQKEQVIFYLSRQVEGDKRSHTSAALRYLFGMQNKENLVNAKWHIEQLIKLIEHGENNSK